MAPSMTSPTPPPAAESELVMVPRRFIIAAANELEAWFSSHGHSTSLVSDLRAALAAPPVEPAVETLGKITFDIAVAPQPAEPEEAELSYEQICEILGASHLQWIQEQETPIMLAEKFCFQNRKHTSTAKAYRALARLLREREAKKPNSEMFHCAWENCPGRDHPPDSPPAFNDNPTAWHHECWDIRRQRLENAVQELQELRSAAVSLSPPESGIAEEDWLTKKLRDPEFRKGFEQEKARMEAEADLLDQMERDAKSRSSSESLACESAAAWQAIDSIMERIRHQAEKLSIGIDAAIALAKRHGADIHEFICTHCDGKSGNYDCEFCHGDGKYYARVVSEEQP